MVFNILKSMTMFSSLKQVFQRFGQFSGKLSHVLMNLWLFLKISKSSGIQIPWKIMTTEEETDSLSIYSGLLAWKTELI